MLSGQGLFLSLIASLVFSVLGWYSTQLTPLQGLDIFAWRVVWTVPAMLLLLALLKHGEKMRSTLQRFRHEPILWLAIPVNALLLAIQQLMFMWAPLEGRLQEVSLGYFLLPLVMVLVGFFIYKERPSKLQWLAVFFALLGVMHELWLTRAFSWVTLVTALGYPPYLMIRRALHLDPFSGFLIETLFILPVAALMIYLHPAATDALHTTPMLWVLLPCLGIMTATAFVCYLMASKLLTIGLLGILGYVEPVLLFFISLFVLGEPFSAAGLGTYIPIWLGIMLTCWQSAHTLHQQRKSGISI
ncbi:EamA family transporter RarD [Iodobacter sp. HSC-16F04]|uniref:EamA family transporter RarD n=1 Tax=Iodobacter violaceini TaxID=3044271 RepID=A0ABX0L755_9NEIS|nr:EamA family transporter RarD [Iodobacter violacea]NHQ88458.1 EamA family transporter RarD [Iodobacter violacea]